MSSLNDLTDYATKIEPSITEIRTEYLEPITSSTLKYTFRLDQAGYLDTNSMLVFKLKATQNDNLNRVNCNNGVLGGIKRVIFQVGDNVINDVQDVWKYATLKNMNMPESMRNGFLGHYMGNSLHSDVVRGAASKSSGKSTATEPYASEYGTVNGAVVIDNGKSGIDFGRLADGTNASINSMPIGTATATNHQYGITLGTLIPALKGQRIPLFLFDKQRILLTFEFNTADIYCNQIAKKDYANLDIGWCASGDVVPDEVRMVVDYVILPTENQNELMEQTKKQGGYELQFYDVVNVEKNIVENSTNGGSQDVEHRIGQNKREVHNIIQWKETSGNQLSNSADAQTLNKGQCYFGKYQKCQGFAREEYNVNIDGVDIFDHWVYSPLAQYNEMSAVLGADLSVARPQYVCDENTCVSELAPIQGGLISTMKPLGCSLRNGNPVVVGGGRMIGNYPIVFKYKRDSFNAPLNGVLQRDDYSIKCSYFCEVSRFANVLNTMKGMSVVVSY